MTFSHGSLLGKRDSSEFPVPDSTTMDSDGVEEDVEVNVVDLSDNEEESRARTPPYLFAQQQLIDPAWLAAAQRNLALLHSFSPQGPSTASMATETKRLRISEDSAAPLDSVPLDSAPLDLSLKSNAALRNSWAGPSLSAPSLPHPIPVQPPQLSAVIKSSPPSQPKALLKRPSPIVKSQSFKESEVLPRVPDVCEHFRKSLASFTMTNNTFDVDEHFKRALGADWKAKVQSKPQ